MNAHPKKLTVANDETFLVQNPAGGSQSGISRALYEMNLATIMEHQIEPLRELEDINLYDIICLDGPNGRNNIRDIMESILNSKKDRSFSLSEDAYLDYISASMESGLKKRQKLEIFKEHIQNAIELVLFDLSVSAGRSGKVNEIVVVQNGSLSVEFRRNLTNELTGLCDSTVLEAVFMDISKLLRARVMSGQWHAPDEIYILVPDQPSTNILIKVGNDAFRGVGRKASVLIKRPKI